MYATDGVRVRRLRLHREERTIHGLNEKRDEEKMHVVKNVSEVRGDAVVAECENNLLGVVLISGGQMSAGPFF